jgi:hypothetical protein
MIDQHGTPNNSDVERTRGDEKMRTMFEYQACLHRFLLTMPMVALYAIKSKKDDENDIRLLNTPR